MSQNIERSIRDLREMDTLASGKSPIHAVSAGAKLLVTVVYVMREKAGFFGWLGSPEAAVPAISCLLEVTK